MAGRLMVEGLGLALPAGRRHQDLRKMFDSEVTFMKAEVAKRWR
jgi:hypothetical protein